MGRGRITGIAGNAAGNCSRVLLHFIGQVRFPKQGARQGDERNLCPVQDAFHGVSAAEPAYYHDGTADNIRYTSGRRGEIAFVHMGADTAYGRAVAADFNGIDAGFCKELADRDTVLFIQSVFHKIVAVDFNRDMQSVGF